MSGSAFLLLAAVGGYWVLERGAQQKGGVRLAGLLVGLTIIVVSFFGVACKVATSMCGAKGGYTMGCPYLKSIHGGFCPFSSSESTTEPSAEVEMPANP